MEAREGNNIFSEDINSKGESGSETAKTVNWDPRLEEQLESIRIAEVEIMQHLDDLAEKMPEIYKGYARMVKGSLDAALRLLKVDLKKGNKIMMIGEILARGIESYGTYKAVKQHNELIDRYVEVKRSHASHNIDKIRLLHEKMERMISTSQKFFSKAAEVSYDFRN